MRKLISLILFLICTATGFTQVNKIEFGVVSKELLTQKSHPKYAEAPAAILYKYQKSYVTGNSLSTLRYRTDYFVRIKIYNKKGLDYGTYRIPLIEYGYGDFVKSVQGTTLTLENDTIYSDLVGLDHIHRQRLNSASSLMTVTFPNIKAGAVLDLAYTIISYSPVALPDVVHQFDIPVDRSEADITIPDYMIFQAYTKGFEDIHYNVYNKGDNQYYEITATDLPAIEEEEYVNNIDNYRAVTQFEIKQTKYPLPGEKLGFTWEEIVKTIYKSDYFGDELKKRSYFKKDLKKLLEANAGADSLALADSIFEFVKQRMTWNNVKTFVTLNGLKEAYEQKKGNSGEINLILTAMLREAGLDSNPVLLATRDYGIPVFPSLQGFNYALASIHLNGKDILYDATDKYAVRNILPLRAINWNGKLVRKDQSYKEIALFPDKLSQINVNIDARVFEDGHIEGSVKNQMSQQYMIVFRGIKEIDFHDDYKKILENLYDIEIDSLSDNSHVKTDTLYTEDYLFSADNQTDVIGKKMYISPLLFHALKENPFKSKDREYPIDFIFPKTENYQISFTLPEGYRVVHLPDPISVKFVDDLATFKFQVNQSDKQVSLQMQLISTKSVVAAGYYKLFQEFYNKIIEKHNDKIVIEKIETTSKL